MHYVFLSIKWTIYRQLAETYATFAICFQVLAKHVPCFVVNEVFFIPPM